MKKNLGLLLLMLVAVAAVALLSVFWPKPSIDESSLVDHSALVVTSEPSAEPDAVVNVTATPTPETTADAANTADADTTPEVKAYVLITASGVTYEPIALTAEGEFTLRQNGSDCENTVHVTQDSMWMADANCDNQDCVHQGTVSLENKEERLLGNYIMCLPNQITLELLTPEEWKERLVQNQ